MLSASLSSCFCIMQVSTLGSGRKSPLLFYTVLLFRISLCTLHNTALNRAEQQQCEASEIIYMRRGLRGSIYAEQPMVRRVNMAFVQWHLARKWMGANVII